MADFTLDVNGATGMEQRQLQTLIKTINPEALERYGIDGGIGGETRTDLSEILENPDFAEYLAENGVEAGDTLTTQEAIEVLKDIATMESPAVDISDEPISRDFNGDQMEYVQNLVNIINPDLISEGQMDGLFGNQTRGAIEQVFEDAGLEIDLDTASMNEIVTNLETVMMSLPQRHIVEECQNLWQISEKDEIYGGLIDEYTQELMDSGDPRFASEEAARIHATQAVVAEIAHANGLEGDADAHVINPGDVLIIPELTVDALKNSEATLDWDALDASVGPGGPCGGCGEVTTEFTHTVGIPQTNTITPGAVVTPGYPQTIILGPDCEGELYRLNQRGQPIYHLEGTGLNENGYYAARQIVPNATTRGSCKIQPEGGDNDPDPGPGPGPGPGPQGPDGPGFGGTGDV